jgi:hypothetical protein
MLFAPTRAAPTRALPAILALTTVLSSCWPFDFDHAVRECADGGLACANQDAGSTEDAGDPVDAGSMEDAGPRPDAGSGRCDPNAAFEMPTDIPTPLQSSLDQPAAWLTEDELVIYLTRDTADAGRERDLYMASRPTLSSPFDPPSPLPNVNSDALDDNPTTTSDGLRLYFHSAREDDGGIAAAGLFRLFVASRTVTNGNFGVPVLVNGPFEPTNPRVDPFISRDGDRLYFVERLTDVDAGTTHQDLFVAERDGGTTFSAPRALTELNTSDYEVQPILTADEKVIYFSSNRDGRSFDIWRASRTDRTQAFGPPELVTSANSELIDTPTWVSKDDCELWIARGATGPKRTLLRLQRPPR